MTSGVAGCSIGTHANVRYVYLDASEASSGTRELGMVNLTIAEVEAVPLVASFETMYGDASRVPKWLSAPSSTYQGSPRIGQFSTLVRVRTEDGTEGVGEAFGVPNSLVTTTIVDKLLAPMIIGRDAGEIEALWSMMFNAQKYHGHTAGFYMEAISGVDIALWDLVGKSVGLPVHRLLGGPVRQSVDCYASPVPFLATPEETGEAARSFVDDGFRGVKLKIGRGISTDVAHVAAARDAVGSSTKLYVDCNCAYDISTAIGLGRALDSYDIAWLEEPLETDDVEGLSRVRRSVPMAVAAGENIFSRFAARSLVTAEAIDVLMPNITRSGGISELRRIAALCSAFHVRVAPHGVGSAVGLRAALEVAASTENVSLYEYNRLPNPLRDDLPLRRPELVDGRLTISGGPGLGLELDEAKLNQFGPAVPTANRDN